MSLLNNIKKLFHYEIFLRKNREFRKIFHKSINMEILQDGDIFLKAKFVALAIQIIRYPLKKVALVIPIQFSILEFIPVILLILGKRKKSFSQS